MQYTMGKEADEGVGYFNSNYYQLDKSLVASIYVIKQSSVSRKEGKNLYTLKTAVLKLFGTRDWFMENSFSTDQGREWEWLQG